MAATKYISMTGKILLAAILLLFFTAFGGAPSFIHALHGMWQLVSQTAEGRHLRYNYYGVLPIDVWFSVRLMFLSVVIAAIVGISLAIGRVRTKHPVVRFLIEAPATFLEAIPEPLYVLMLIIGVLVLIEDYSINLPVFPYQQPTWVETIVPALSLGLPAAFYLMRIVSLSFQDEIKANYVTTAIAKGLSPRRVFYRHVTPNVWPMALRQLPVVAVIIVSSAFFAEYMFGYQGSLFYIFIYGFGWKQKPDGLPVYEPGVVLLNGLLMIAVWAVFRLVSNLLLEARHHADVQTTPAAIHRTPQYGWTILGAVLFLSVIVCSIDPHLVTANGPNQEHLLNFKTMEGPPFTPRPSFPLGTDFLGRDLLARALQGTAATLLPALGATLMIVICSALIAACALSDAKSHLSRIIRFIGEVVSAMPVFFLLLLALLHRRPNTPDQELIYFSWVIGFEICRGAFAFLQNGEAWFQFGFVEGVTSIGKSRFAMIFTHFRSWLIRFSVEFGLAEFSRVLSLMTMLAVFQIFAVETLGWPEFAQSEHWMVMVSGQNTWFSIIGDAMWNGGYMGNQWYLYAPTLLLLFVTVGLNLISRGIKGKA